MDKLVRINDDTGEFEVIGNMQDFELINKNSKQAFLEKQRIEQNRRNNKFYNVNLEKIEYLSKVVKLTNSELTYLFLLGCYVSYHNGNEFVPLYKSDKNKTGIKTEDIKEILGINNRTTWKRLKDKLEKFNIIKVNEDDTYLLNSNFVFKGEYLSKGGHHMSIEKDIIKRNIKSLDTNNFGTLIKLLPYVSCKVPALVKNPYETDVNKLIYMKSVNDICKTVGIQRSSFMKLWNLQIDNKCLLFALKNNKGIRYGINFNILHNGDKEKIVKNCKGVLDISDMM